jgi:hypothetical protein
MEMLVATAKMFGQRPSTLLDITDPVLALNFDLAAAVVSWQMSARSDGGPE